MVSDITRIDANVAMLKKLFQQSDEEILKSHKMKDLNDIFIQIYGYKIPNHIGTKANALKQLKHYYHSLMRADALRAEGRRYN